MNMIQTRRKKAAVLVLMAVLLLAGAGFRFYDTGRSLYEKIQLFSEILRQINRDYVDEKDPTELIDNAIKGMVSGLDPHTTYLSADEFEKWNQSYEGYSGIGIAFDIIRQKITVMSVFREGPSDRAGLMPGDRIVAINGKSVVGMKRDDVPLKLMGPRGSMVTISVERRGWDRLKDFTIVRDEIHVESIPFAFMIKPGIGYINIDRFSSTTGSELEEKLNKLENLGMRSLIIDLRQNGGGYLDAAVDVVDKFLPGNRRIVFTQGRISESYREFFSTAQTTHPMIPVIVLIDRISASASEIVAGALQDWDRALIVGETSFGKGLVQSQYRFRDGSTLLMTTAKYYTPTGRLIQRPFDDKSQEEYYTEVWNDSLRQTRDKNISENREVFYSKILNRRVYGGGGITPDIFFNTRQDTVSQIVRRMIFHPERLFYTFVEDYLKDPLDSDMELNEFIKTYHPNGKVRQHFLAHVRKHGFEITDEEYTRNQSLILFMLKQTIANKVWGDEARYKVQVLRDYPLLESLDYMAAAEQLLAKAYSQTAVAGQSH